MRNNLIYRFIALFCFIGQIAAFGQLDISGELNGYKYLDSTDFKYFKGDLIKPNPSFSDSALDANFSQILLSSQEQTPLGTTITGGHLGGKVDYGQWESSESSKVFKTIENKDQPNERPFVGFFPGSHNAQALFYQFAFTQTNEDRINWLNLDFDYQLHNEGDAYSSLEVWLIQEGADPVVVSTVSSEGQSANVAAGSVSVSEQIRIDANQEFVIRIVVAGQGENQAAKDLVLLSNVQWSFFKIPYPYWVDHSIWSANTDPFVEHEASYGLKNSLGLGSFEINSSTNTFYFEDFLAGNVGTDSPDPLWRDTLKYKRSYRPMDWTVYDSTNAFFIMDLDLISFGWFSPNDGQFILTDLDRSEFVFHHFGPFETNYQFNAIQPVGFPDTITLGDTKSFQLKSLGTFPGGNYPDSVRIHELTFVNPALDNLLSIDFLANSLLVTADTVAEFKITFQSNQLFEPLEDEEVVVKYTNYFTGHPESEIVLTKRLRIRYISPGEGQMKGDFEFDKGTLVPGDNLVGIWEFDKDALGADSAWIILEEDPYHSNDFGSNAFTGFPDTVWVKSVDLVDIGGGVYQFQQSIGTFRTDTIIRDTAFDARTKVGSFYMSDWDRSRLSFTRYDEIRDHVTYNDTLEVKMEVLTDTLTVYEGLGSQKWYDSTSYPIASSLVLFAKYGGLDSANFPVEIPNHVVLNHTDGIYGETDKIEIARNYIPEKDKFFDYTLLSADSNWSVLDTNLVLHFVNTDSLNVILPAEAWYQENGSMQELEVRLDTAYGVSFWLDYQIEYLTSNASDFLGTDSLSGRVYFAAGDTVEAIPFMVATDGFYEAAEKAIVRVVGTEFGAVNVRDSVVLHLLDEGKPTFGLAGAQAGQLVERDSLEEGFVGNFKVRYKFGFPGDTTKFELRSSDPSNFDFDKDTLTLQTNGDLVIPVTMVHDNLVTGDQLHYIYVEPIDPLHQLHDSIVYPDSLTMVKLDKDTAQFVVLLPSDSIVESQDYSFQLVAASESFAQPLDISFFLNSIGGTPLDSADFDTLKLQIPPMNVGDTTTLVLPIFDDTLIEPSEKIMLTWNASANFLFDTTFFHLHVADNDTLQFDWVKDSLVFEETVIQQEIRLPFQTEGLSSDTLFLQFKAGGATDLLAGQEFVWVDSIMTIPGDSLLVVNFFNDEVQEDTERLDIVIDTSYFMAGATVQFNNSLEFSVLVSDTNDVPTLREVSGQWPSIAEGEGAESFFLTVDKFPQDSLCVRINAIGTEFEVEGQDSICFRPGLKDTLSFDLAALRDNEIEDVEEHAISMLVWKGADVKFDEPYSFNIIDRDTAVISFVGDAMLAENDTLWITGTSDVAFDPDINDSLMVNADYSFFQGATQAKEFNKSSFSWFFVIEEDLKWGTDTMASLTFSTAGNYPILFDTNKTWTRVRNGETIYLNWGDTVRAKEGDVDSVFFDFTINTMDFSDSALHLPYTIQSYLLDDLNPNAGTLIVTNELVQSGAGLKLELEDDLITEPEKVYPVFFEDQSILVQDSIWLRLEDDDTWAFNWDKTYHEVWEDGGGDTLWFGLSNDYHDTLSVGYFIKHIETQFEDFHNPQAGLIKIAPGETRGYVVVKPKDDFVKNPDKAFELVLAQPSSPAILGAKDTLECLLMEDDGPALYFTNFTNPVLENGLVNMDLRLDYPLDTEPLHIYGHWVWSGVANENPIVGNENFEWQLDPTNELAINFSRLLNLNDDDFDEGGGFLDLVIDSTSYEVRMATAFPHVEVLDDDELAFEILSLGANFIEGDTAEIAVGFEHLTRLTNDTVFLSLDPASEYTASDIDLPEYVIVQTINPNFQKLIYIPISTDGTQEALEEGFIHFSFRGIVDTLELGIVDKNPIIVGFEPEKVELKEGEDNTVVVPVFLNTFFFGELSIQCKLTGDANNPLDYIPLFPVDQEIVLSHDYPTNLEFLVVDDEEEEDYELIGIECFALQENVILTHDIIPFTIEDDDKPVEEIELEEVEDYVGYNVKFRGRISSSNLGEQFGKTLYHMVDGTGGVWITRESQLDFEPGESTIIVGLVQEYGNGHIEVEVTQVIPSDPLQIPINGLVLQFGVESYSNMWVEGFCLQVEDTTAWGVLQNFNPEFGDYWKIKVENEYGIKYPVVFPRSIALDANMKISDRVEFEGAVYGKGLERVILVTKIEDFGNLIDPAFTAINTDSLIEVKVTYPQAGAIYNWSFGDGEFGVGDTTSHVYTTHGLMDVKLTASKGSCITELTKEIFIIYSSDIDELQKDGIRLYPNPTSKFITIEKEGQTDQYNYMVQDAAGRVIMDGALTGLQTRINLKKLPRGVYFLQLQNDSRSYKVKVVKE